MRRGIALSLIAAAAWAEPRVVDAPPPEVASEGPAWFQSFDAACAEAKREDKLLFLCFTASW